MPKKIKTKRKNDFSDDSNVDRGFPAGLFDGGTGLGIEGSVKRGQEHHGQHILE